jgi:3-hydroxyacyl-CoA dehydrogenase/3a,7a,12a-trihydroxy-5b-cholest-24-enoyl-CoA hydratase
MGNELRFDGKVAIVTGAGNGLGRTHALLLASRGAKVVVNDLGGAHTGGGASSAAADKVVEEIKAAGGEAVANYDSVEDGAKIVQSALDNFKRIDVVVNNAGILRDVSFPKMTQDDWDLVYRVHVLGAYRVTAAAWPHLREQKYGRVIFTSSAAGIYGNFGQANYAMAKLGTVGFANALAIEGRKANVFVNTIAPLAGSRMTETVLPPELLAALRPEYVSALVAYLAHESCEETGSLFEVGGGYYAKLRWERTKGKMFRLGRAVSVDDIKASWKTITGFDGATHPANLAESMAPIMSNVQAGPSKGGNQFIDVDLALGYESEPITSKYDERDVSLYALGVGAAHTAPTDPSELGLVYELNGAGFHPLPTMTAAITVQQTMKMMMEGKVPPGMNYGLDRVLHGEHYTEVLRPLPPKAKLTHKGRVKAIYDKGKGAVALHEIKTYDEDGELLAINELTIFVKGAGGWGGDSGPKTDVPIPDRAPDATIEEKTSPEQALLYRLSGDVNPLHADPSFAKNFGFAQPILHGLCSFGFAGRHVIKAFAKNDPRYLKSIRVRFVEPVIPGETLVTEMWKDGERVVFRMKVKERDKVVLSNAAVELYKEIPKKIEQPKAAAAAAAPAGGGEPNSADVFAGITAFFEKNKDVATKAQTLFLFKLLSPESAWSLDTKAGVVTQGEAGKPECTLELTDADFMDMVSGKADPMKLFTSGKLKISGNIMASQKLDFLQKVDKADVMKAMAARGGGAPSAGAASAPAAGGGAPSSADIFTAIGAFFAQNKDVATKAQVVYLFNLKSPDSAYTLDTKLGTVTKGEGAKSECTLELTDADFMDMVSGKADPMKLFTSGKLKISGNIMASQKLDFLQKLDKNEVAKAAAAKPAAAAAPAAPAPSGAAAQAPAIFEKLGKRFAENPALAGELGSLVQFFVKGPDSDFIVDASGKGAVLPGRTKDAKATFTISDADLAKLASGKQTILSLFMHGALRVDGDALLAHRLHILQNNS